jgi:hypothetical protein
MNPLQQQLVGQLRAAYYDSGLTYEQIAVRTQMSTKTVQRDQHADAVPAVRAVQAADSDYGCVVKRIPLQKSRGAVASLGFKT